MKIKTRTASVLEWPLAVGLALTLAIGVLNPMARAEGEDGPQAAEANKDAAEAPAADSASQGDERYLLAYQLAPGEQLRYRVEHVATVDTTMEGSHQKTQSRSVSTKIWTVGKPTDDKRMRFSHAIEAVRMWQEVSGRKAVEYDSQSGDPPPAEYEAVAAQIGKPLAEFIIDATGKILDRKDHVPQSDLGFGAITVELPAEPVAVGATWTSDAEVRARTSTGQYKKVTIRQRYELEKVQTGVATISMRSEIITPINDARIRSQIVQRLTRGKIKFDIDAGHIISKELEWNETVLAFNGPDSNMKYLARFTETLVTAPQTARRDSTSG